MYLNLPKLGRKRPDTGKIRSFTSINAPYTISVFRRISPYTVTVIYDRNTVTCNPAKYGRIRSVYGMYTVVYDTVYYRLRQYTESVTIDLGYGCSISNKFIQFNKFFKSNKSIKFIIKFIKFLRFIKLIKSIKFTKY